MYALYCSNGSTARTPLVMQGWALRACTEVAGLAPGAGSLRFAKQQLDAQYLIRLASFLNLSFTASAGECCVLRMSCWPSVRGPVPGHALCRCVGMKAAGACPHVFLHQFTCL